MTRKATTVRIEPTLQQGLETLSKVLKRPMNQLVNEALNDYVARRSLEVEQDLSATVKKLRAYRRRDPNFDNAIAAAAKAEAKHGHDDPVEGTVVMGDLVDGQIVEDAGPLETEIHQLLHG
jgi:predicted DNA-binding protein